MKKIFFAFAALIITQLSFNIGETSAQTWQWAKRGGGITTSTSGTDDELRVITIDKNGNSYIIANIVTNKLSGDIDLDGNKLGKGNGVSDICIASFDCSGKYRWAKIIGGRNNDVAYDLKLDTLGGVYISGTVLSSTPGDTVWFDKDTIYGTPTSSPKPLYKTFFIAKYDTSGNYKWLRFPEPDTLSTFSKTSVSLSSEVSPNGTISLLAYLGSSGSFAKGGYIISTTVTPGLHIIKYGANGNFIKGFPLSISEGDPLSLSRLRMAWDYKNDVYYLLSTNGGDPSVSDQPKFGTTKMTGSNCLAKFSNTGASLWVKQSSTGGYTGAISSTPILDANGDIYIGTSEYSGGNFLGYIASNKSTGLTIPCAFKINAAGSLVWGKNGSSSSNAKGICIAVSPTKNEVAFAGGYLAKFYWDKDSMYAVPSNAFFIRLKASDGSTIAVDSITGGDTEWPSTISVDKNGNFYLGGIFTSTLDVKGFSTINKYGGKNDFYIAKFGVADCKAPVSINENDLQKSIVKIYPNPAQDVITFEALQSGSEVRLFNVMGQQMHSFVAKNIKEQVSINHMASGMYLVQIRNVDGEVYTAKIVKE
jgi:hypothetical protein